MNFLSFLIALFSLHCVAAQLAGVADNVLADAIESLGFPAFAQLISTYHNDESSGPTVASLLTSNAILLIPDSIPNGTLSNLLANPNELLPLLSYHIATAPVSNSSVASLPNHSIIPTALTDNSTVFLQNNGPQQLVMTVDQSGDITILDQSPNVTITRFASSSVSNISYAYAVLSNLLTIPTDFADTLTANGITEYQALATSSNNLGTIASQHGITVLVPNDAAFASVNSTLTGFNSTQLGNVINGHVINGTYYSTTIGSQRLDIKGQNLTFSGGSVSLQGGNSANILQSDVLTNNGVVHIIDTVLMLNAPGTRSNGAVERLFRWNWILATVAAVVGGVMAAPY